MVTRPSAVTAAIESALWPRERLSGKGPISDTFEQPGRALRLFEQKPTFRSTSRAAFFAVVWGS